MRTRGYEPGGAAAVLLPGSGSSADFVRRSFGPALPGWELITPEPVPGASVVASAGADLDAAVRRYGARLAGGVSLGAHIAARWAAGNAGAGRATVAGLLVALPAWVGAPGPVAAASAAAAAEVERLGPRAAAAQAATAGAPAWVAAELAAAWPRYGAELAATLRATAAAPGPTRDELRAIDVPVGLVAFRDDPMHPADAAEEWAALIPRCAVEWLRLDDPAADRSVLGRAAVRAWERAAP
jgi:pimeloyl-ACP methyl ester carboxylesterase